MTTSYYQVEDRTLFARGMPWIAEFTEGVVREPECAACGAVRFRPEGDMRARLEPKRGTQWPDLIGDGHLVGLFVASARFVEALGSEGVRVELGGRVRFAEPGPKRLSLADAPDYHWVDGGRLRAATMDYEASGYAGGVDHCAGCGRRLGTKMPTPQDHPWVFDYDASTGLDLFTTDMNPRAFFCTERVLDTAKKHRLTNVAFQPLEEGRFAKPVSYWR